MYTCRFVDYEIETRGSCVITNERGRSLSFNDKMELCNTIGKWILLRYPFDISCNLIGLLSLTPVSILGMKDFVTCHLHSLLCSNSYQSSSSSSSSSYTTKIFRSSYIYLSFIHFNSTLFTTI